MRTIIVIIICSAIYLLFFSKTDAEKAVALNTQASEYIESGLYNEAEALLKRALAIREKTLGPDHPDTTISLNNLAELYRETGRYPEAEPLHKRALAIREKIFGSDHPNTVTSVNNLAVLYNATGRYAEAESLLKRALAIREKTLGTEHPDTATSLNNLAGLYRETGHYAEAEPLQKQALAITEKVLGPEHPVTATVLSNLAGLYSITGRYSEAEALHKRALAIREKALGPEHPDTATSLNNLASRYTETGSYAEAEPLLKRALAIREKTLGTEHPDTATSLNNLAGLYRETGHYAEAEPLLKRALAITEKSLGIEHPDTATSLNNLAGLYTKTGRYADAEPLLKRALAITEKSLGPEHPDIASSLDSLGGLYYRTGRYAEAEPLFKRALTIREKTLGFEHPDTATSFDSLGALCDETGRYAEAEPLLKRALAIREKSLGPEHPDTATSLNNLASLYRETDRYAKAESLEKRALSIRKKTFGPEHPATAGSLGNLALLYFVIGSDAKAEFYNKEALRIFFRNELPSEYANVLHNYSAILSIQGNHPAAIFFGKQAVNILQGLRQNVLIINRETLKTFDKSIEFSYHHLANLLIEQGRLVEAQQVMAMFKEQEYFEFIRRDVGTASRLTTRANYTTSEEPWIKEYDAIAERNVKISRELGVLKNKAKYFPLNVGEKNRLEKLSKEDKQTSTAFNDYLSRLLKAMKEEIGANVKQGEGIGEKQSKSLTTLKNMLKGLGDGSVLLHYLITDKKLHIILTTPDTQLARHRVIKAKDLNRKISEFHYVLSNPKIDPRPLSKELYDILLAPVAKDLQASKAKTLMLSLDGSLRYLPFSALHDGTSYVVQSYRTVMYAEVARDKVSLPTRQQWKVAALGVSDKVHADFPPLPNVATELSSIVQSGTDGIIPGEIKINKSFTEKTMTETSNRNPVVHIASHFKFVPGTDRDSFLLLGDGSTLGLDRLRNSSFFQNSELLTLSACETAMGTTGKGAEIEGFAAIAMNQGAKSVIATLWSISDKSTALLMKEFYRFKEEKKLTKAEALRQAQLVLLKGNLKEAEVGMPGKKRGDRHPLFKKNRDAPYAHPYYWAPFILAGNWK